MTMIPIFFFVVVWLSSVIGAISGDAESLLRMKSKFDSGGEALTRWRVEESDRLCEWEGVRECKGGRVSKLVLEKLNLTGAMEEEAFTGLDQLRVLSLKGNSISGKIPGLSGLVNLKSLFLSENRFSGEFPRSISELHRLKVVVMAENSISGEIPQSILKLRRLYFLDLHGNRLSGEIPPLNQTSLRFLNLSGNLLSGEIPASSALVRFNSSSFSNNLDLCGEQIGIPCRRVSPSQSPAGESPPPSKTHNHHKKLLWILIGTLGGGAAILAALLIIFLLIRHRRKKRRPISGEKRAPPAIGNESEEQNSDSGRNGNNVQKAGGFSWEGEGIGSLVFCGAGDQRLNYSLEDLLKASAETLGRGIMGSTYKAVMESGFIVTVKRLKDAKYPRIEDFRRQMEGLGRLRHPNLVPLRAYFQAKEERLLVYDYFPNGSLFSLIHGSRTSGGGGKPLHWTSCLKIAEDLASGLVYIHQAPTGSATTTIMTHGNLKSSNVLLGSDFESCLTDYGLTAFRDPNSADEPSAASLFYRAPECRDTRRPATQPADVYSFGVLVLELLTGKTPFQDLVQEHGPDIPRWVRSVREEETESGDEPASSGTEAASSEEKLQALLNIAMACVAIAPESRPTMRDVLRMIRDARAEAQVVVSSNSSDHSPGRWSDTVQSLPREQHLSI